MRKEISRTEGKVLRNQISGHSCIHGVEGRTGIHKLCIHNYECRHCPFDQWLEEIEEIQNSLDWVNLESDLLAMAA